MKNNKKIIVEKILDLDDGSLINQDIFDTYTNIKVHFLDYNDYNQDDPPGIKCAYLTGERFETDKETEKRLEKEKNIRKKNIEKRKTAKKQELENAIETLKDLKEQQEKLQIKISKLSSNKNKLENVS